MQFSQKDNGLSITELCPGTLFEKGMTQKHLVETTIFIARYYLVAGSRRKPYTLLTKW